MPALREQSGFCGALHLTAQERSEALLVVLWETEDDAERPHAFSTNRAELVSTSITDLLNLRAGSVTIWEVDARGAERRRGIARRCSGRSRVKWRALP